MINDRTNYPSQEPTIVQQMPEQISLQALKNGDRVEFSRLVEKYSGVIYRLAMKLLNNTQVAGDVH
jgi:DNA-directed RNA polymerase specialized sigma24 family protein